MESESDSHMSWKLKSPKVYCAPGSHVVVLSCSNFLRPMKHRPDTAPYSGVPSLAPDPEAADPAITKRCAIGKRDSIFRSGPAGLATPLFVLWTKCPQISIALERESQPFCV